MSIAAKKSIAEFIQVSRRVWGVWGTAATGGYAGREPHRRQESAWRPADAGEAATLTLKLTRS